MYLKWSILDPGNRNISSLADEIQWLQDQIDTFLPQIEALNASNNQLKQTQEIESK